MREVLGDIIPLGLSMAFSLTLIMKNVFIYLPGGGSLKGEGARLGKKMALFEGRHLCIFVPLVIGCDSQHKNYHSR